MSVGRRSGCSAVLRIHATPAASSDPRARARPGESNVCAPDSTMLLASDHRSGRRERRPWRRTQDETTKPHAIELWLEGNLPGYRFGVVLVLLLITFVVHGERRRQASVGAAVATALQGLTLLAAFRASQVSRRLFRFAALVVAIALARLARVTALQLVERFERRVLPALRADGRGARRSRSRAPLWRRPIIDVHTVLGAICIYVLIGMLFAFLYATIDLVGSDPFFVQTKERDDGRLPVLQLRHPHDGRLRRLHRRDRSSGARSRRSRRCSVRSTWSRWSPRSCRAWPGCASTEGPRARRQVTRRRRRTEPLSLRARRRRASAGKATAPNAARAASGALRSPPVCATLKTALGAGAADHRREPAEHRREAAREPVQEREVHEHPHEPRGKPAQPEAPEAARPRGSGRWWPRSRGRGSGTARTAFVAPEATAIVFAACRLPCIATSATPGSLSSVTMSPTTNTSGCPGSVRSGSAAMRPAWSTSAPVAAASCAASGDACTPAAHTTVCAAMCSRAVARLDVDAGRVDVGDPRAHHELDAEAAELARRRFAKDGGRRSPAVPCRRRRAARAPSAGSNVRNSPRRLRDASSRICPAISTPVGPAPTTTIVSHSCFSAAGRRDLGHLERAEDPALQLERVVDRLHARREHRELVVPEVRLTGARGDDQAVVGHVEAARRGPGARVHHPAIEVEAGDLGELDRDVLRPCGARAAAPARSDPGGRMPVATW